VETAGGETLRSRTVIGNADVAHLFGELLPARRGARRDPPSLSGWTAVARATRGTPRAAHTVLFPDQYLEEFADLFDRDRPPVDPTVYLCAQEVAHRRSGWPEAEPVFLMANAPAEPVDGASDPGRWRDLRDRTLARARDAGLLGEEDAIVWERNPTDLARRFPGTRGAIYGASSNSTWAAFRRPANRVDSVPGLYLASGSAHPGGGVPMCLLSGRAAARAVTRDLGISEQRATT
jgi:1-hydroxycarotenoid 3,4-desaturase